MVSTWLQTENLLNVGWGLGLILISLVGAWLLYRGLERLAKRVGAGTLAARMLGSMAGPVALLVIIQGLYLALNFFTPLWCRTPGWWTASSPIMITPIRKWP